MGTEAWRAVADELDAAIRRVASRPEECARSPGRDFTRSRKLGLEDLLRLIVTMGSDTLGMELLRAWGMDAGAPTVGALCQQWAKLNDEAMPMLHAEFLSAFEPVATEGRYWLLACDGTGLAMAPDASDAVTRLPPARGSEGRNGAHLTCALDVARGVFGDMVAQGGRGQDEPGAACELVDRCRPPAGLEALWLMDRNFFCLNLLWHLARAGAHFACRLSDARTQGLLAHWLGEAGVSIGCVGSADATVDVCVVRSAGAAGRTSRGSTAGSTRRAASTGWRRARRASAGCACASCASPPPRACSTSPPTCRRTSGRRGSWRSCTCSGGR